jgi:hypothetical protein
VSATDPGKDQADAAAHRKQIDRLLRHLPKPISRAVSWLLRPQLIWLRVPLGVALIIGGIFAFLPILGLWMLPLGALLLAEDIPAVRAPTVQAIDAVERWWNRRRRAKRSGGTGEPPTSPPNP